jgi:hypothetical protein
MRSLSRNSPARYLSAHVAGSKKKPRDDVVHTTIFVAISLR